MNLARSEVHCPDAPDLPRVDPRVLLARRSEFYILTKIGNRLRSPRHSHPVSRQSDSATIFCFNHCADIQVNATVSPQPEIVDAANMPSHAASGPALKRDVYASSLRGDAGLTREYRFQAGLNYSFKRNHNRTDMVPLTQALATNQAGLRIEELPWQRSLRSGSFWQSWI